MPGPRVGLLVLAAGCAVAAIGLLAYQAWWTIAFAVGGVAAAILGRGRSNPTRTLGVGLEFSGSGLLAILGVFLVYGSQYASARPCDECTDPGPTWLAAGLGSIGLAVFLAILAVRGTRRRSDT